MENTKSLLLLGELPLMVFEKFIQKFNLKTCEDFFYLYQGKKDWPAPCKYALLSDTHYDIPMALVLRDARAFGGSIKLFVCCFSPSFNDKRETEDVNNLSECAEIEVSFLTYNPNVKMFGKNGYTESFSLRYSHTSIEYMSDPGKKAFHLYYLELIKIAFDTYWDESYQWVTEIWRPNGKGQEKVLAIKGEQIQVAEMV